MRSCPTAGRIACLTTIVAAVAVPWRTAQAQVMIDPFWYAHSSEHLSESVKTSEAIPNRPVVLPENGVAIHTGVTTTVSKGVALDAWTMPLGAGIGLLRWLEVGFETEWQLKPWDGHTLISYARPYARYLVIERLLALEVGVQVPTVAKGMTGVDILAPARHEVGPLKIFGQGRLFYAAGAGDSAFTGGAAATGLYAMTDRLFATGSLGVTIDSATDDVVGRKTNVVLPLGIGVGSRVLPGLAVQLAFLLRDLASNDQNGDFNGFDARAVMVTLVQDVDLGPANTDRRTAAEREAAAQASPPTAD